MTKKYWMQLIVCFCIILIGTVLGVYYYQEYIAPESYTIGTITTGTYKELEIKDYLSDDTVLFSQNINDVSFSISNNTATYDYNFETKEFNGLEKNYLIYVNNYIVNNITTNAGTISGSYTINFQDVENETLCSSDISISFAFRSLSSTLKVSLPSSDIGYLMNYFKTDNFIITLAISPFTFGNKDGEVDEKVNQIIELSNEVNTLSSQISILNSQITDYIQDIADLTTAGEDKSEQIIQLQNNISNLQSQISDLTNQLLEKTQQLETIQSDNSELLEENSSLNALVTNQQQTIATLNQTITQLQNQVTYYEQLLEAYQNSTKLIVTYTIDDIAYEVQLVEENGYATKPQSDPIKEGYVFEFWSIDGITAFNFETTQITTNTTIVAVFSKLHTVKFMYEDEEYTTQTIKNGEKLTEVNIESTTYKVFKGWLLNGQSVDFNTHVVLTDETVYADIDYYFDVIFNENTTIVNSQIVLENNNPTVPTAPSHFDYIFKGWSENGIDLVDVESTPITKNTNYTAVYEKLSAGLYNSERTEKIMTWQELINNNYFSVYNGRLQKGSNIQNLNGYLVLDDSVTELYMTPFIDCISLTGIDLNNVVKVGTTGPEFYGCSNLEIIVFGDDCTSGLNNCLTESTTNVDTVCYESEMSFANHFNNIQNEQITTVYVLKEIVDNYENSHPVFNFDTRTVDGDYYVYTR